MHLCIRRNLKKKKKNLNDNLQMIPTQFAQLMNSCRQFFPPAVPDGHAWRRWNNNMGFEREKTILIK